MNTNDAVSRLISKGFVAHIISNEPVKSVILGGRKLDSTENLSQDQDIMQLRDVFKIEGSGFNWLLSFAVGQRWVMLKKDVHLTVVVDAVLAYFSMVESIQTDLLDCLFRLQEFGFENNFISKNAVQVTGGDLTNIGEKLHDAMGEKPKQEFSVHIELSISADIERCTILIVKPKNSLGRHTFANLKEVPEKVCELCEVISKHNK